MLATDAGTGARGDNHFCAAYGCNLPGGISPDRGEHAKFYCRWHFRVSVDQYDAVSARINARFDLFRAAVERRETAELPAKPDEDYYAYLVRLDAECRKVAFDNLPTVALAPALSQPSTTKDGWKLAARFVRMPA